MVNNFNKYLFNKLLEQVNTGEVHLYFSSRFRYILKAINNPIAIRLLESEKSSFKVKKTYIDIDEKAIDKITFISIPKIVDIISNDKKISKEKVDLSLTSTGDYNYIKDKSIMFTRYRIPMKINRFINEIYNKEYKTVSLTDEEKELNKLSGDLTKAQQLNQFVDKYKSIREPGTFELVQGEDIKKYYLANNNTYIADVDFRGTLQKSCMNDIQSQDYLDFYANNEDKVSLLIMKDKNDSTKATARALVWTLDDPVDRIFMDRVYTTYQHHVELFLDYARTQNWLYKIHQTSNHDTYIFDPITKTEGEKHLIINEFTDNGSYPYMDTLKYYDSYNEDLTNDNDYFNKDDTVYHLESTVGGYSAGGNLSYEELVELCYEDIINDFEEYAMNYFGNNLWQFVDDDQYVKDHISSEIDYYLNDFENLMDEDDVRQYIKDNSYEDDVARNIEFGKYNKLDEDDEDNSDSNYDDVWEKLDDLDKSEIFELSDDLGIRDEFVDEYAEDRYRNYSAKDIIEEYYGNADEIDKDMWNMISNYVDEEEAARWYAENEDEEYLRERYGPQ